MGRGGFHAPLTQQADARVASLGCNLSTGRAKACPEAQPDPDPSTSSFKFGRKIFYVNYLSELSEHVKLEQLGIPRQVLK